MTEKRYAYIYKNKIYGIGGVKCLNDNFINIEITQDIFDEYSKDKEKYIFKENKIIINPDYDSIINKRTNENRKSEILKQLNELDTKRIRAVCENEIKDESTGQTWLDFYNQEIIELRKQLSELSV